MLLYSAFRKSQDVEKRFFQKKFPVRNFFFFETSALNAENVDNLFEMFTYKLIQFYNKNKSLQDYFLEEIFYLYKFPDKTI